VVSLEPFEGPHIRALGYDMRTEPERRIAMEKAIDENKVTFTGKIALGQEIDHGMQPGILIYAPVYRKNMPIDTIEQRRAAMLGWVYSPLQMKDVMQGINPVPNQESIRMKIFDGSKITSAALLYTGEDSNFSYADKLPVGSLILRSDIGGREWTFQFIPVAEYLAADYSKTRLIAIGGSIINLLVFFLIRSYRNTYRNALSIADNLIAELCQSEDRYRTAEAEFAKIERQLEQSHKMETLGQLTGGIAHDFNNVLAIMLGYSNLALTRYVTDKKGTLAHHLEETIKAGERARELVAFMLTYSRAQTGDNPVEVIDPSYLIKEALRMLTITIPANIKLQSQIDADVNYIRISPVELHQIVMNLVINARDSIVPDRGGYIDVHLSTLSEALESCTLCKQSHGLASCKDAISGKYISFSVTDNGCGINEGNVPLIFNPFFSTKEVGKGTGLGLSVVQAIVRRAGGCITVNSHVGLGTMIQVRLPVVEALVDLPSAIDRLSANSSPGNGARILVVDDEPALANYLAELLEGENYVVDVYTDSVKALNYFRADPQSIDAVITDQAMPDKSGIEIAGAMLALRPDLPVFLFSGYSDTIDENTELFGIRRFFNKPVNATELLSVLSEEIKHPLKA